MPKRLTRKGLAKLLAKLKQEAKPEQLEQARLKALASILKGSKSDGKHIK